jgi:L-asparagine transporter-like permease
MQSICRKTQEGEKMSEIFKWIGIAVATMLADALFCLFLALLVYDDDDKWLPAFVVNCVGFVVCLTILIGKAVG